MSPNIRKSFSTYARIISNVCLGRRCSRDWRRSTTSADQTCPPSSSSYRRNIVTWVKQYKLQISYYLLKRSETISKFETNTISKGAIDRLSNRQDRDNALRNRNQPIDSSKGRCSVFIGGCCILFTIIIKKAFQ